MNSWPPVFFHSYLRYPDLDISLDYSRIPFSRDYLESMKEACDRAYVQMRELEAGGIKNIDEGRQVGHYWLRDSTVAPSKEAKNYVDHTLERLTRFAQALHSGKTASEAGHRFTHVLLIGIGGSALGPQFVVDALSGPDTKMRIAWFDNTDPEGFDRILKALPLAQTLVLVVSKGGETQETENGMRESALAFEQAGLHFPRHAVAVTVPRSKLDEEAKAQNWLKRFPLETWIGGRTSVMSVVGLLPMALLGLDVESFRNGAAAMDRHTRIPDTRQNAAMLLALAWHFEGGGKGDRDMVILPYKDRLSLLTRYLQQLVMESLGKEKDLDGNTVRQGLVVYGNKGSTDQHAYVQQLRDGPANFFVTFIEVMRAREGNSPAVAANGVTSGDYLQGFLRGTREALSEKGRSSLTLSLPAVDAKSLGALIALYERAVGFYASLVHVNAYNQPGVAAGKVAAEDFIALLTACRHVLAAAPGKAYTLEVLAARVRRAENVPATVSAEAIYQALLHLAANDPRVTLIRGAQPFLDCFTHQAT